MFFVNEVVFSALSDSFHAPIPPKSSSKDMPKYKNLPKTCPKLPNIHVFACRMMKNPFQNLPDLTPPPTQINPPNSPQPPPSHQNLSSSNQLFPNEPAKIVFCPKHSFFSLHFSDHMQKTPFPPLTLSNHNIKQMISASSIRQMRMIFCISFFAFTKNASF